METIAENKDAKTALYAELDAICPERTVFASNTSSLNIFELMPASAAGQHGGGALLHARRTSSRWWKWCPARRPRRRPWPSPWPS